MDHIMDKVSLNIVLAFHSYTKYPCFDGLVSVIMAANFYKNNNIFYIPYWRTNESFQKIKKAVMHLGTKNIMIIYMDCSPELTEEVDFLSSILHKTRVLVIDHHSVLKSSKMNVLQEFSNFTYVFDQNRCSSIISYDLFKFKEEADSSMKNLLSFVQFTDYDGQNVDIAGKSLAYSLAQKTIQKTVLNFPYLKHNVEKITSAKMELYYLLRYITPSSKDWEFLYSEEPYKMEVFNEKCNSYLSYCFSILSGNNDKIYCEEFINNFIELTDRLVLTLNNANTKNVEVVGGINSRILIVYLDISKFGRNLEPLTRDAMIKTGSNFAIIINPPTHLKDGTLMYYLSLRRVNESFDARDLAELLKSKCGSNIGGGHPWASGVTFNQEQYDCFKDIFLTEINEALA